jgi:guanine deaminase
MKAIRADLLDFCAAPAWGDTQSSAVRWRPDHWLIVDDAGRIAAIQAEEPAASIAREDWRGHLLLPGFIDCHVHSAQMGVVASHGTSLIDWLNTYTFPAELEQRDPAVAHATAEHFLDALLAHGTTAAAVFPTVHAASANALFEGARARGMRLITGKVLMDRHAPAGLLDDPVHPALAQRECQELIRRWHGQGRNAYAVTVRFAPTSSPAQLAMAGALCRSDRTLYLQTHWAENREEVRWVGELFPAARSYLDVYAQAGLLHRRSLLAHGIWFDAVDRRALQASGATVVHCPSSNLFLGSGLFDWAACAGEPRAAHAAKASTPVHAAKAGIAANASIALTAAPQAVSIGSDVGGGTQLCLLRSLADAYRVAALQREAQLQASAAREAPAPLTAYTALHAATRGAAHALQLGHEIGSLEPGLMADFTVWRTSANPLELTRQQRAQSLHERLFAWMMLADERHLCGTWVAGTQRYAATEHTVQSAAVPGSAGLHKTLVGPG